MTVKFSNKTFNPEKISEIENKLATLDEIKYSHKEALSKLKPSIEIAIKKGYSLEAVSKLIAQMGVPCNKKLLTDFLNTNKTETVAL